MTEVAKQGPVHRTNVYLESRYQKLVRDLPQTIHYCPVCKGDRRRRHQCPRCEGRGRISADSVQELISRSLLPAFRAKTGKFHGAGREDVDVRMLGRGRPFIFEVIGARQHVEDLETLRAEIHQRHGERLQLAPFTRVARERIAYWKESHFEKIYRARALFAAPPDPEKVGALPGQVMQVKQRTPERVLHRRADLERVRKVEIVAVHPVDELRLDLDLRCQHGTYVKEWLSGEQNRTSPSLPELVSVACVCEQLDVLEILTEE